MLDQWEYKLWLALKVCYCTPHDKQTQLSSPCCSASLTPLPSLAPKKAGVKTAKNGRMRCWGDFKRPAKGKPLEQITYSVHDWRSSHCKEHKYEYIFQTPQEHKKNRRDRPFEQKPDWGASPISSKHTYHNLARGWERLGIYIWTLWWAPLELLRWIMHNRYNRYR